MASTRTQIYLTDEQRRRLDQVARREGKSLAQLIRDAVDGYLEDARADPGEALTATFGRTPNLQVPERSEWERGEPPR